MKALKEKGRAGEIRSVECSQTPAMSGKLQALHEDQS